jgi:hypothetical protein
MRTLTDRTNAYGISQNVTLDKLSNCLAIKNAGNSICVFNDDPLQPGECKIFSAWPGELLKGRYTFYFRTPAVVPLGYVQSDLAVITEQFYLPETGKQC